MNMFEVQNSVLNMGPREGLGMMLKKSENEELSPGCLSEWCMEVLLTDRKQRRGNDLRRN